MGRPPDAGGPAPHASPLLSEGTGPGVDSSCLWSTVGEVFCDPLFVVDAQGSVLRRNPAAVRYSRTLAPPHLHQALLEAKRRANRDGPPPREHSPDAILWQRVVRRCEDESWIVMDVRRLDGDACVVRIAGASRLGSDPAVRMLEDTFAFSPAEMSVVERVVHADCPRTISIVLGLSVNTVRSHLRNIYAKLGANTYAEAVRILMLLLR